MIKSILVPLDGSEHSEAACWYAAQLSRAHQAKLLGLAIVDVPGIESTARGAGQGASHFARDLRLKKLDEAQQETRRFLREFEEMAKREALPHSLIHDGGPVHQVIFQKSIASDLIVIGEEANFQFETSNEPGDTLRKLLEMTACPVLVCPKEKVEITRVLMAYDNTPGFARVMHLYVQLNPYPQAEIILLHADEQGALEETDFAPLVEYLSSHNLPARVILRSLPPTEAILDTLERERGGLVIMGGVGHSKIRDFFYGNITLDVMNSTDLPLFVAQ